MVKKEYVVTITQAIHANIDVKVKAESEDEAMEIAEQRLEDGKYDKKIFESLKDGECSDPDIFVCH